MEQQVWSIPLARRLTVRLRVAAHGKGGGFDVVLTEGIAVAGRLVCMPPKDKDNGNHNGQVEPDEAATPT